jgi:hypothetical protein
MFGSLYSNFNYKNLKLNSKKNVIERQVRDRERTFQNEKKKIDSFHDKSTPSFHIDMPETANVYNNADFGELLTMSDASFNHLLSQEQHKNLFTFDQMTMTIPPTLLQQLKHFSDLPQNNNHSELSDSEVRELISQEKQKNLFDFEKMTTGIMYNMKSLDELKYDEKVQTLGLGTARDDIDTMSNMDVGFDFDAGAASIVHNAMYDNLLQMHKKTIETPFGLAGGGGCNVTIDDVYKKNIRAIYNVYQPKYKDNINVTGFGDFIRGCYFLLQFCEQYQLQFKIIVNHPISYFLLHYQHQQQHRVTQSNTNIKFFVNNNWSGYFFDQQQFIHSIPGKTEDIQCSFMSYLVNDIEGVHNGCAFVYSISYPFGEISEKHKQTLRHLLEPSDFMKNIVSSELTSLGLFPHKYAVIHIRSGDAQLNGTGIGNGSASYFEKLVNEIRSVLNVNSNILIISDSIGLKQMLNKKYPILKMLIRPITHLGEGVALDRVKIQNTLSDFYLLSFSNVIHSFSCYEHGTGFSQWCATTYNIPYFCKYVV